MSRRRKRLLATALRWTPQNDINTYGGLWFKAADLSDGSVSSWTDHSGTGQIVQQSTGAAKPTASASPSTLVTFDGGDSLARTSITGNVAKFIRRVTFPDSTYGMPFGGTGKGFTCTGLTRIPNTTQFWVGNHGEGSTQHDGSGPWNASLVRVDYSGGVLTKLQEIDLLALIPGFQSVQGVAYDTSDDTLWFTTSVANTVYHITQAGALVGDNITASWQPNGLAYVPSEDALWITQDPGTATNSEKRSCATGNVTVAATTTIADEDQLYYDPSTGCLLLSYGANTVVGRIRVYGTGGASGARVAMGDFILDSHSDTVEGIVWEGKKFYIANDAYYHSGSDGLNQLCEYEIVPPMANEVNVHFKGSVSATTGADTYVEVGAGTDGPLDGYGFGIYPASTTTLTIAANTAASGTTQRGVISAVAVSNMTTARVFSVKFDMTNDLITLWVDGSQVTTGSLSATVGGLSTAGVLRLGTNASGRIMTGTLKDVIIVTGPSNRTRMEAYLTAL